MSNEQKVPEVEQGYLQESLDRGRKAIIAARAADIHDGLEMHYKRLIEDTEMELRSLGRDITNRFDFSPENTITLKMVNKETFNPKEIVMADRNDVLQRRNLQIAITELKKQYNWLFGHTYEIQE